MAAFVVGFSGAMMPGPLLAVTISESARRGGRTGPMLVLGHALLEIVLVAAVVAGLVTFLTSRWMTVAVGLVGGGVMCWMGQDMIRSAPRLSLSMETSGVKSMHPVLAGIVVSLSNPYWTIWWATIGLVYLMMGLEFGLFGVLVFFAGHILADLVWYSFVSYGVAHGRAILPDKVYRIAIGVCGVIVLAFGGWFIWSGTKAWMT